MGVGICVLVGGGGEVCVLGVEAVSWGSLCVLGGRTLCPVGAGICVLAGNLCPGQGDSVSWGGLYPLGWEDSVLWGQPL